MVVLYNVECLLSLVYQRSKPLKLADIICQVSACIICSGLCLQLGCAILEHGFLTPCRCRAQRPVTGAVTEPIERET